MNTDKIHKSFIHASKRISRCWQPSHCYRTKDIMSEITSFMCGAPFGCIKAENIREYLKENRK